MNEKHISEEAFAADPDGLLNKDYGQMVLDTHDRFACLDLYNTFGPPVTLHDVVDLSLEGATAEIRGKEEQFYRNAILGTDWQETAVLRLIHYPPGPAPALGRPDDPFTIEVGEYAVERYEEQAPPLSERVTERGERPSVATITWPLLERLAKDHDEIARLVDVALGPDAPECRLNDADYIRWI